MEIKQPFTFIYGVILFGLFTAQIATYGRIGFLDLKGQELVCETRKVSMESRIICDVHDDCVYKDVEKKFCYIKSK